MMASKPVLRHKSFSRPQLLVFILAFALIGFILIKSFASPNPSLPGDLNNDNKVDITDLSILLSDFNSTDPTKLAQADINNDSHVDILDLSTLLSNYGRSVSLNVSPDNTVVNGTNGKIVDANGHTWTITSGGQVAVDGVVDPITSSVLTLAYESGKIWQKNGANLWWYKILPSDTWLPTGGTSVSPIPGSGGGTGSTQQFGYDVHIGRQSDPDNYTNLAQQGGAKTLRDDFGWNSVEGTKGTFNWSSTDSLMTYAVKHNMRMLILADQTPQWASGTSTSVSSWWWAPPINASDYGNFAGKLAGRYGSNGSFWTANPTLPKLLPAGIEIWNEPNLSGFWGSQNVDPVKYTAMLKSAYTAIKAVDPSMTVISAGIAPAGGYNDVDCNGTADGGYNGSHENGINYLQAMYQNGAAGYMDAVGYHPYNWGGTTAASYFNYHLCSAWSQVNDTPISVRTLMSQYGDGNKKVWATEIGAPTDTGHYSETEQASLATQLVAKWKADSWAGNFYWYDLRNDGTDITYTEDNFGTVRTDSSLKPAYNALKTAWQ